MVFSISTHFLINNPCIPDYVKQDSRGKAVVLQMAGMIGGEFLAMTILFRFMANISPYISFAIAGLIVLILTVAIFFFVREPAKK